MRAPSLLRSAVALGVVALALPGCDTQTDPDPFRLRVLTLNLDAGADLSLPADDGSPADLRVIRYFSALIESDPGQRAARAADAIAQELPDVIALQEVLTVRSEYPADWTPGSAPDAETPRFDVLPVLLDSLAARGTIYEVAAEAITADWERTARVGPADADLRFTERAVVLVRLGVEAEDLGAVDLSPRSLLVAGEPIDVERRSAVARVKGVPVATFRLDPDDEHAAAKTAALAASLGEPVVVAAHVGRDDVESPLQALSDAGFRDAWAYLIGEGGQTCCRSGNDPASDRRADVIAARGAPVLFVNVALFDGRGFSRYEGVLADLSVW